MYFKLTNQHITQKHIFNNLIYINKKYFQNNNYYISHIILKLINIINTL